VPNLRLQSSRVLAAASSRDRARMLGATFMPLANLQRVAKVLALGLLLAIFSCVTWAAPGDYLSVPALKKRVTDLTATLSPADEARIEARLKEFETKKGAQIAVLIVDSTQPEPAFDYATRVFTEWKLGRKGVDDGVLFLVAKSDRKMQMLTGPGISGSLTDAMSKRIIAEVVAPKFRSGDFAGGIDDGVAKMIGVIDGEILPPPPEKRVATKSSGGYENFFVLAIFAAMFVGPMLRAVLGRFMGATATGGVTGAAAWFIAGGLALPIISGVLVFLAVLLMGSMGSSVLGGRGGRGGGGGWIGGGGFGGGGSSGGGGFSGGGGGFDGGGASGDW
jgi:uncharacterized protein